MMTTEAIKDKYEGYTREEIAKAEGLKRIIEASGSLHYQPDEVMQQLIEQGNPERLVRFAGELSGMISYVQFDPSNHQPDPMTQEEAKILLNETYEQIIDLFKQYVDMPQDHYKMIALWIIGTYFHKQFTTYPFLFLNAMRGSGKTRVLKLIAWLQANGNGDVQNNMSEAVLFRTAQERGLIIDEFEQIGSKEKAILRELLNAAYKQGGKVRRMKKVHQDKEEKQIVEEFDLFTPIAMANINGIEEVLSDRCITLVLEKSNNPAFTKKIENFDRLTSIKTIKENLSSINVVLCSVVTVMGTIDAWNNYIEEKYTTLLHTLHYQHKTAQQHIKSIELDALFNKLDEAGIDGRNLELTLPLLLVASLLNEVLFAELLGICKETVASKRKDEFAESKDVSVIEFISQLQPMYQINLTSVKELVMKFREFSGEEDHQDMWLNPKWFGKCLKRLNLITANKRDSRGNKVTLNISKAKEKIKIFRSGDNA